MVKCLLIFRVQTHLAGGHELFYKRSECPITPFAGMLWELAPPLQYCTTVEHVRWYEGADYVEVISAVFQTQDYQDFARMESALGANGWTKDPTGQGLYPGYERRRM